jgi:AmpD protein
VEDLFLNQLDYSAHPWLDRLRGLLVSTHFLLRRTGSIVQFVSTEMRAWHAGVSRFAGREHCNDFSIGVELEGTDQVPYADAQYEALARLVSALRARYTLVNVRGHEHIAPERKTDPGPAFEWARFATECGFLRRSLPFTQDAVKVRPRFFHSHSSELFE